MLSYPPPSRGPLFQLLANKAFLESPDHQLSLELNFRSFVHTHTHKCLEAQKVFYYPPPSRGPLFQFLGNKGFLESPDQ